MALRAILPNLVVATDGRAQGLRIELWDSGADYGVVAGPEGRAFTDPSLRCEERARKASIVVALVLEPPTLEVPAARVPPPADDGPLRLPAARGLSENARQPSSQTTVAPKKCRPTYDCSTLLLLEVAGLVDAAPRSGTNSLWSGGAALRLFVGARHVGGLLGIAGLSPTTMGLGMASARLTRVPIDVGVRGQLRRGRLGLSLEGGAVMTIQITEGVDVTPSLRETRLELGVRAAAKVEYWVTRRIAPFVAIHGEYVPLPYDLVLPAVGTVGMTPRFWVGAMLGLALRLR